MLLNNRNVLLNRRPVYTCCYCFITSLFINIDLFISEKHIECIYRRILIVQLRIAEFDFDFDDEADESTKLDKDNKEQDDNAFEAEVDDGRRRRSQGDCQGCTG